MWLCRGVSKSGYGSEILGGAGESGVPMVYGVINIGGDAEEDEEGDGISSRNYECMSFRACSRLRTHT